MAEGVELSRVTLRHDRSCNTGSYRSRDASTTGFLEYTQEKLGTEAPTDLGEYMNINRIRTNL
jgi:hypothetical protein